MDGFRDTATASEASSSRGNERARRVALLAAHDLWAWPMFAARFLPPRTMTLAASGDPGERGSLRVEMAECLATISPGTRPRL